MLQEINVLLTANIMDVLAKFLQVRQEAARLNEISNINATPDINVDPSAINTALQNSIQPVNATTALNLKVDPVSIDLSNFTIADITTAINNKISSILASFGLTVKPDPVAIDTTNISQANIETALNSKISSITTPLTTTINLSADIKTDALSTAAIKSAIDAKIASVGRTSVNQKAMIVIDPVIDTSRISAGSIKTAVDNAMAMIGNLRTALNTQIVIDIGIATAQNRLNVLIRQAQQLISLLRAPIVVNINSGASSATIAQLQAQVVALQTQLSNLGGNGGGSGGGGGPGVGLLSNLKGVFAQVAAIMGTVMVFKWFANVNSEIEQYRMQIGVLVKDTQRAEVILQELKDFADRTPYETSEVVRAGKQLMSAGITDYKTYLTTAGDWAAAVGVKLEETVGAMARANSGQFGEAIERMRELGISTQDLWAQGLQFSKSNEFLGTADQLMTALNNIVRNKAGGMMDTLSQSWTGLISTAKSQVEDLGRALSEPFFNAAKGGLKTFTDEFQKLKDGGVLAKITAEAQSIFDLFKGMGSSISSVFSNVDLGNGISDVFKSVYAVLKDLLSIVNNVGKAFADLINSTGLMSGIGSILSGVAQVIKTVADTLASWKGLPNIIQDVIVAFGLFKLATKLDGVVTAIGIAALAIEASLLRIRTALTASTFASLGASLASALNITTIAANIANGAAVIKMAFVTISRATLAFIATPAGAALLAIAAAVGYVGSKYYEMKEAQNAATEAQKNATDMAKKVEDQNKKTGKSAQELAQEEMDKAFSKEKQVQADIQNDEKRADIKSRLNKAMGMDAVELAKTEYEASQKSLKATIEAEEASVKIKTQVAQKALAAAKTTEERVKAEKQLADVQKQSLTVEEMKANVAEKQAAYYQAVINKQAELGKFAYSSMKLSAEVAAIEKMGGDATVKRYSMVKTAISEYLSEIDKIRSSQMAVSDSAAKMNIAMAGITAPKFVETGSVWDDKQKEVVGYKQAVGVNLQAIELMNQQQDSLEKVNNVNRLNERLGILRAMLSSEQLGAEQRKQLIMEERNVFASYTKSITDGITDAMSKIQSLQSKAISSASSTMGLLEKYFPKSNGMTEVARAVKDAWNSTGTHTTEQISQILALTEQFDKQGINLGIKITDKDVMQAFMDSTSGIADTISTLKTNMNDLMSQAKQIGAHAANNYFAEWNGYIDQLKQTINGALATVSVAIDTTQASQAINQIKQQFTDTVSGMQSQISVELPKPTINYNTFQQTFQVGVNIQGNTLKDLGDAVDNARNLFGQELKLAFEEANAQYGI